MARALAIVVWSEEEEELIRQVHGKRNQGRERQRLMHNRTADEKGFHRIERYKEDGKIKCERCGQCSEVKRMTQWPMTTCKDAPAKKKTTEDKEDGEKEKRRKETERGTTQSKQEDKYKGGSKHKKRKQAPQEQKIKGKNNVRKKQESQKKKTKKKNSSSSRCSSSSWKQSKKKKMGKGGKVSKAKNKEEQVEKQRAGKEKQK